MSSGPIPSHLATSEQEYTRLGIAPDHIGSWEDGLRTSGGKGIYEWWYFDAHLQDASKVVIVFYTKPLIDVDKPLKPYVAFTLDRPDGTHIEQMYHAAPDAFAASKEGCDVRIGPNVFAGDLHAYQLHLEMEGVTADLTLTGTVPPWRPATGHLLFGARDEHYFAWLPAVPQGEVAATITLAGTPEHFTGIGYHDHNWGNISIARLIDHWYWARGKIGAYTLIASYITVAKRYGYRTVPIFMLACDGRILADDGGKVRFTARAIQRDPATGKPVANLTRYEYRDADHHYVLTFTRRNTILRIKLVESIHGIQGALARLIGFDGAFLRFTGDLALTHYEGAAVVESQQDEAIWELMYLAHAHAER
jgi:hypothetical protein